MEAKHVILYNGPRRVGKDTAVKTTCRVVEDFNRYPHELYVAEPLKNAVHRLWGYDDVPFTHFEAVKDQKLPELDGNTPRELYIDISEEYVKKNEKYDPEHFGKVAVRRINRLSSGIIVVGDCGFDVEVKHITAAFGAENVQLVRIKRPMDDGVYDSRGYVYKDATDIEVFNVGTLNEFQAEIAAIVSQTMLRWGHKQQ